MNDFGFGLLVLVLVLVIAFMGTYLVHFITIIQLLKDEVERLQKRIYELINSGGSGDNK